MASTPIVSYDDVNRRFLEGDLEEQYSRADVETQITDAVDYAADHWGSLIESRISSGRLRPNSYKRIIANAVLRVVRNPEGYTSESEGGYSYGLRSTVSSGDLWFTDDEIATLSGVSKVTIPGTIGVRVDKGWS
jgi:hypothetical protein